MENMKPKLTYSRALTIAGSDPSGGAGIQADLKTFSAHGVYGMSAITAVVDENTVGVTGVYPIPPEFVCGQIRSCLDDIGADAIKIGMLHSSQIIEQVVATLSSYPISKIVVDPVMVATSGDSLVEDDALDAMRSLLIPSAMLITPNISEAETLLGGSITLTTMEEAAREISQGITAVLLKGGHLEGNIIVDIFYDPKANATLRIEHPKVQSVNTHGTGCTLSSAITSNLALGRNLTDSVRLGVNYIHHAIEAGALYRIGHGRGPVFHGITAPNVDDKLLVFS